MNRLVLASLNQGARLLGVLERRCRNHLLQRTDVRAGAIWQNADDFPDGPYDSRYDYGLTDFEEENECHEPQEMPDEVWPRPKLCGDVYHSSAGGTFVCGKLAGHRALEGGDHESDGVTWHPVADGCCTYHAPAYFDDSPDVFRHGGQTFETGPRPRLTTPHSSAARPPVVAGAVPGSHSPDPVVAESPAEVAPPDPTSAGHLTVHLSYDDLIDAADCIRYWRESDTCDDSEENQDRLSHLADRLNDAADLALYPMQPQEKP